MAAGFFKQPRLRSALLVEGSRKHKRREGAAAHAASAELHGHALAAGASEAALPVGRRLRSARREVPARKRRQGKASKQQQGGPGSAGTQGAIRQQCIALQAGRRRPSRSLAPATQGLCGRLPSSQGAVQEVPASQPAGHPPVEVEARHERQQALQLLPRIRPLAVRGAVRVSQRANKLLHFPGEPGAQLPAEVGAGRRPGPPSAAAHPGTGLPVGASICPGSTRSR